MTDEVKEFLNTVETSMKSSFDAIKTVCEQTSAEYGAISLAQFEVIIRNAKWPILDDRLEKLVGDYNKVLDAILRATVKNCLTQGTELVTLEYIDKIFQLFMDEYKKTIRGG